MTINVSDLISRNTKLEQDPDPTLTADLNVNGNSIVDGTGPVNIDGLNYPTSDGPAGSIITSDGSGNLTLSSEPPVYQSEKGAPLGVATLNLAGKVYDSQIPSLAITDVFVVTSQAEMLGLGMAQLGDVAIRTDQSLSYILREEPPSILANWEELLDRPDIVTSVHGRTGDVISVVGDYDADQIDYDNSTSGIVATNVQSAIDETENRLDNVELISISALQPGDNITSLTNNAGFISDITAESIGDLSDVDVSGITTNDVLVWNGTNFVPVNPTVVGPVLSVFGRIGVVTAQASDYDAIQIDYDNSTSGLTATNTQAAIDEIEGRVDNVEGTAGTAVQPGDNITVLVNNANYISDITAEPIGDLSDVDVTGIVTNDVLQWNGTNFVPASTTDISEVDSVFGRTGTVVAQVSDYDAIQIDYDNSTSGLTATDAQAAIDEIEGRVDTVEGTAGTALQPGDNITQLVNNANYISDITAEDIGDLSDVNVSGINTNDVLQWNGSQFIPVNPTVVGPVVSVHGRTGVVVSALGDYSAAQITYDNSTSGLTALIVQTAIDEIDGRLDTVEGTAGTALQPGDNITQLVNNANYISDITAEDIGDLSDVNVTGISTNDVLSWNGTTFVPVEPVISIFGRTGVVTAQASDYDAIQIDYDNSTSGLIATDAQAAIDEIEGRVDTVEGTAGTAVQPGDNISVLTNNSGFISDITGENIGDLADVNVIGINTNDLLQWNGVAFVPITPSTVAPVTSVHGRIGDVVSVAGDYDAIQIDYNNATSGLTATDAQAAIDEIEGRVDTVEGVAGTAVQPGDNISVLTNNSGFISDITAEPIGDLSDVDVTGISTNDVLQWNGTNFVPVDPTIVAPVTSVHGRTGDVVSALGDYAAAQITYDNVVSGLTASLVQTAIDELDGRLDTVEGTAGSALQPGDNVSELVNDSGFISDITGENIGDLSDVNTTGILTNDVLQWNGTNFVPVNPSIVGPVDSVFGRTGAVVALAGDYDATQVDYSNSTSGLAATDTQGAIDELDGRIDTIEGSYIPSSEKGSANGVATLGVDGLIPNAQIPPLAITETFVVASQAAMLALSDAETGDIAVRTDENKSYILAGADFSNLADWQELLTPTDTVLSVNGQTGVVVLTKVDVGLGNVDNTSDLNKPISTATQTALDTKADKIIPATVGNIATLDASGNLTDSGILAGNIIESGDNISLLNNDSGFISDITAEPIGDLSDVDVTGISTNDVLQWNGTNFVPVNPSTVGPVDSVFGRTGAVTAQASDYDAIQIDYNNATSGLTATDAQAAIDEIESRVDTVEGTAGSALQPGDNVSELVNDSGFISDITAEPIGDLSDVDVTGILTNDVLQWNGTNFVPASTSDISEVDSVFGRTGTVVAQASDYDAIQIDYDNSTSGLVAVNAQAAIDELDVNVEGRMRWLNTYDNIGETYQPNDVVRDGDWTMVANTVTSDRPAPQANGAPEFGIDPNTAFGISNVVGIVKCKQEYTTTEDGWLEQLQVKVPNWTISDTVTRVSLNIGDEYRVINDPLLDIDNEWVTLGISKIALPAGTVINVWLEIYKQVDASQITGRWDSKIDTGSPSSNEFNISSNNSSGTMTIDHEDLDGLTRTTELRGVVSGSIITLVETNDSSRSSTFITTSGDLTNTLDYSTYTYNFVDQGSRGPVRDGRTTTVTIDVPVIVPTDYNVFTDGYAAPAPWATVVSELTLNGVVQADTDDAYGINLLFQPASVSPDWDVLASSNGAGGTGGDVDSVFGRIGDVVALAGDYDAIQIDYDNSTSGLIATDAQAAIDEIEGRVDTVEGTAGTAVQPGDNISVLTNNSGFISDITGENIGDLSDVDVTGIVANQVLQWNGTTFVPTSLGGAAPVDSVFGRTGAVVAQASDYDAIQIDYSNTTSGLTASDVQAAIDEIEGRVDTVEGTSGTAVQPGDNITVLSNNAGYIADITGENIGDLADVNVSGINTNDVLQWNGTQFVPVDPTTVGPVASVFGRTGAVTAQASDYDAVQIDYSNATSGLTATDVQAAIDEIDATAGTALQPGANISTLTNDSGFISDITGEDLNDLADVNVTGVTDGQVLSYNSSTTDWEPISIVAGTPPEPYTLHNGGVTQVLSGTNVTLLFGSTILANANYTYAAGVINVPSDGVYEIDYTAGCTKTGGGFLSTGGFVAGIYVNGTLVAGSEVGSQTASNGILFSSSKSIQLNLLATDNVEIRINSTIGNTSTAANGSSIKFNRIS